MNNGCPYYPDCGCGTQSGPHSCEWRPSKAGDRVRYRAFTGDVYNATVTGVRNSIGGLLWYDLDIEIPGTREPFHTTAVRADRVEPLASPRNGP